MIEARTLRVETRRRVELRRELIERARVWLPDWRPREDGGDFLIALFDIAARLESEVAQRLDKAPLKLLRNFYYWLGGRGLAGQAGRLPVVFGLAAGSEPLLAAAPVQMQATPAQADSSASPEPVTFETEQSLLLIPGALAAVVGANAGSDQFYLPPAGFSSLDPPKPGPSEWTVQSLAKVGATQLQLQPALGLDTLPTLLHQRTGLEYRVVEAAGGLVTIDPPVGAPNPSLDAIGGLDVTLQAGDRLTAAAAFDPFNPTERNRQEHAVYVGSESLLNIPADAEVTIAGLDGGSVSWSYWGKVGAAGQPGWKLLTPAPDAPGLTLRKPAGSIEVREIAGKSSRWLRGTIPPGTVSDMRRASRISLTVNCRPNERVDCPAPPEKRSKVAVEAIANTTPLVLDSAFYPLGTDPRLFDAFYIGCPEAFSKRNASVQICLKAFDATAGAMTAARLGAGGGTMLFAIANDGRLYRFKQTTEATAPLSRLTPVRPPLSESGVSSLPTAPVLLNRAQPARLSTLSRTLDTLVATTAGSSVWLWSERAVSSQGKWYTLGEVWNLAAGAPPGKFDEEHPPAVLIFRENPNIHLIALREKRIYEAILKPGWDSSASPSVEWKLVPLSTELENKDWAGIIPVFNASNPRMAGADFADGWIAVSAKAEAYWFQGTAVPKKIADGLATEVAPLALRLSTTTRLFVAQMSSGEIGSWNFNDQNAPKNPLKKTKLIGGCFDWSPVAPDGIAIFFAETPSGGAPALSAWFPLADTKTARTTVYSSAPLPALQGAPASADGVVVVPATAGAAITVPVRLTDFERSKIAEEALASALLFDDPPVAPAKGDFIETEIKGGKPEVAELADPPHTDGNRVWLEIPNSKGGAALKSTVHHPTHRFNGEVANTTATQIKADKDDDVVQAKNTIVISSGAGSTKALTLHTVDKITNPGGVRTLTVKPAVPSSTKGDPIEYIALEEITTGEVMPLLLLGTPGSLPDARLDALKKNGAYFPGADPLPNAVAIADSTAKAVVLAAKWKKRPEAENHKFTLVTAAIFRDPLTLANTSTTNPALSWEYFDGQAWWRIKGLFDGTSNLRTTGAVTFCVPAGLQPTEVAGRKSYWIRARLVGGDYGQETVTLHQEPDPDPNKKGFTQTVERSRTGITPPQYESLDLHYSVCCASNPDYLITEDGGGTRDQSAANTIEGVNVELFMSLAESVRRAAAALKPGAAEEADRAIYLGFDSPIAGGPISVLFLLEEGKHSGAFPLRVDVLRETGFQPVVGEDNTRGLNETGTLVFNLSGTPPAVGLFGATLRWVRLRARLGFDAAQWQPKIRAAYLNATFARASETQTLERLGSSDGSPNQRVFLTRPPVLEGTLDLRVREPLGDEEVQALRETSAENVLDELATGAPGSWVLWRRVDDPDDGGKDERVYGLNHDTGEVAFGNGLHGRIPPIGLDSIVAVRYKKGGGAAANRVAAWGQINLVSPLQGVERVVAPQGAAGGSDPQTAEETLRFAAANQFMRDRALTLRDYERLALESSRDVAQARAIPRSGGVRLVVAMNGRSPAPTEAQRRELARFLLERSSPTLAVEGALTIEGPRIVEIRVNLELTIVSIGDSGSVAKDARERISALLDPALGGWDGAGWPLGEFPAEADIAAKLDGITGLEEADRIEVVRADGGANAFGPGDLVRLAPEGVVIDFRTAGAEVTV